MCRPALAGTFARNAGFDQLHHPVNVVGLDPEVFFDDLADLFRPGFGPEKADFQGESSWESIPFLFMVSMMCRAKEGVEASTVLRKSCMIRI